MLEVGREDTEELFQRAEREQTRASPSRRLGAGVAQRVRFRLSPHFTDELTATQLNG